MLSEVRPSRGVVRGTPLTTCTRDSGPTFVYRLPLWSTAAQTGRAHRDTTKPCRLPSPIPGFPTDGLAYSRFPGGRLCLFQISRRTASPIPAFPAGGFAYSRFPGRNERHRAGIGREPWNPHERKNESPCSPWYRDQGPSHTGDPGRHPHAVRLSSDERRSLRVRPDERRIGKYSRSRQEGIR